MASDTTQGTTKDQDAGLSFLDAFLSPTSTHKQATLCGYAGVGKTWLIGHWLTTILSDPTSSESVCIAAPTHKALDVLRQKCGHLPVTFKTLHSLLGVMVRKTDEGETEQDRFDPDLNVTLLVVDEGSMVNKEFHDLISAEISSQRIQKVLYVGDPAQLPPVKEDLSPIFKLPHSFTMREIVRYDGAIIKVATMLRTRIEDQDNFTLPDISQILSESPSDRSVSIIKRDRMYDWAMKARTSNLDCRILAWTNATVLTHNDRMHKMCFPEAPFFGVGERALLGDSYQLRAGTKDKPATDQDSLFNGELLTVTSCEPVNHTHISTEHFPIYQHLVADRHVVIYQVKATRDTGQEVVVLVAQSEERRLFVHKQLNDEIYTMAREGKRGTKEYQSLVQVRKHINRLCPLRHSYACTVHKSQGSTYDISMVDFGDIYRSEDKARLMYVASTRPSKFLVLAR